MVELAEGALLDGQTAAQGFRLARNSIGRSSRLRYVQEFSVAVGRLKKRRLGRHGIVDARRQVARMMGEDIRFHTENSINYRFVFLGKAAIYSAGTTFMSFFAIENRYLTRGTRSMIH
jgi:hypothetical protein